MEDRTHTMKPVKEHIRTQGHHINIMWVIPGQSMAIVKNKIQGEIMDVIDDQVSSMVYYELRWKIVPEP